MKNLPPSFVGTSIATIVATIYVIWDERHFHLWTPLTRVILMGGPSVVLVTYSVLWYLLEDRVARGNDIPLPKGDYALRVVAQLLLGVALAAIGTNLGAFLILFTLFVVTSMIWSILAFRIVKPLFWHDIANAVLCLGYAVVAWKLYRDASVFERSYAAMVADPIAFGVQRGHLREASLDYVTILAFIVGSTVCNLVFLLSRQGHLNPPITEPAALPHA